MLEKVKPAAGARRGHVLGDTIDDIQEDKEKVKEAAGDFTQHDDDDDEDEP
jgi:hypothetical protein